MTKGMFTYDYVGCNKGKLKARIRLSNDNDSECDTFDRIEDIIHQMNVEETEIENTSFKIEIENNVLKYNF